MSRAPSPGMPNDIGMADHFRAIADRFQLFENSPAFTDPNITTKLNKLDDVTDAINNLQETFAQSLRQVVRDEMKSVKDDLKSVKEELTSKIDTVKDDLKSVKEELTSKIDTVKDDLKSVKEELKSVKEELKSVKEELKSTKGDLTTKIDTVKEDLTTKIDTVKDDLTTKIDTVKEDLTTKIDALETSLKINIATRDINSIVRPKNALNDKIAPLYSVSTGAPIQNFPNTRHQVESLSHPQTVRILGELGDLLYDPRSGTTDAAKARLLVLVGIQAHSPFPANNAVANM
ncbi:hypothetical protein NUW58_g7228 [Xylaria curta]|uniref:Uncharacterized protein n=1 Tax=Xylaria curta TaxID=42375 RepID=A0ACC1NJ60_9PEZI|nr:hypothetical protein NUW58_g7228 [Xylaria curta]